MRIISLVKNLLFSLIVFLSFILFLEVGTRLYVQKESESELPGKTSVCPRTVIMAPYPKYGINFYAPNQDFIDTLISYLKYHVTINSFGFRGRNFTKEKPRNTVRIMLLGDSFTYGVGVDNEQTLAWQMEEMLKKKNPEKEYEVINAGRTGAYLESEISLFKQYAEQFHPDILILAYCYNDIADIVYFDLYQSKLYELSWNEGEVDNNRFINWVSQKARGSSFYNFLLEKKAERIAQREFKFSRNRAGILQIAKKIEPIKKGEDKYIETAVKMYEEQLVEFRDYLAKKDIKFMLIIFPVRLKDEEIKRPFHRELYNFAVKNGISALDLRESWLADKSDIYLLFLKLDEHPNGEAFRITAEELIKKLESEKKL